MAEVLRHVHRAARPGFPVLWATDGFATWKGQTLRFFRGAVQSGRLAFGDVFEALHLIEETQGKRGTVNTAYVERPQATLRTWLPARTRRSRHAGSDARRLERRFFLTAPASTFIRPYRSLRVQVDGR